MAATINGKRVVMNEQVMFLDGQTVEFGMPMRIRCVADRAAPEGFTVRPVGDVIEFSVNGATGLYDKLQHGTGNISGVRVEYFAQANLLADLNGQNMYRVSLTIYEI